MDTNHIKHIKKKYEAEWLKIHSVVGVGIGLLKNGRPGVIISLKSPDENIRALIPEIIDGVPIEIQQLGEIKAQ